MYYIHVSTTRGRHMSPPDGATILLLLYSLSLSYLSTLRTITRSYFTPSSLSPLAGLTPHQWPIQDSCFYSQPMVLYSHRPDLLKILCTLFSSEQFFRESRLLHDFSYSVSNIQPGCGECNGKHLYCHTKLSSA